MRGEWRAVVVVLDAVVLDAVVLDAAVVASIRKTTDLIVLLNT
jgi:hypothetical protein